MTSDGASSSGCWLRIFRSSSWGSGLGSSPSSSAARAVWLGRLRAPQAGGRSGRARASAAGGTAPVADASPRAAPARHQHPMPSEPELGLDPLLLRRHPQLVEPCGLEPGEVLSPSRRAPARARARARRAATRPAGRDPRPVRPRAAPRSGDVDAVARHGEPVAGRCVTSTSRPISLRSAETCSAATRSPTPARSPPRGR